MAFQGRTWQRMAGAVRFARLLASAAARRARAACPRPPALVRRVLQVSEDVLPVVACCANPFPKLGLAGVVLPPCLVPLLAHSHYTR